MIKIKHIRTFVFICLIMVLSISLFSCSLISKNQKLIQNEDYYQTTFKMIQKVSDIALKEIPEDWDNRKVWIAYNDRTFIWRLNCDPVRRVKPYDESINSKEIAKNFLFILYRLINERGLPISDVRINIDEPILHNVDISLGIYAYKKSPLFTIKNKGDIDGVTFMKYLYDHINYGSDTDSREKCIVFN